MTILMLGRQLELGHYRAEFLQSYGIHVVFPESKQEAVSAVHAGGYDAILLSYTLNKETIEELVNLIDGTAPTARSSLSCNRATSLRSNPQKPSSTPNRQRCCWKPSSGFKFAYFKKRNPSY